MLLERSPPEASGSASKDSPVKETFEKRKRHKTREDRYQVLDPGREKVAEVEVKRTTSRRAKRGDRRKAVGKARKEVIGNFTSSKFGQERLTVYLRFL